MGSSCEVCCHCCYVRRLASTHIIDSDPHDCSDVRCKAEKRWAPRNECFVPSMGPNINNRIIHSSVGQQHAPHKYTEHGRQRHDPNQQRKFLFIILTWAPLILHFALVCLHSFHHKHLLQMTEVLVAWPKWVFLFLSIFVYEDAKDDMFTGFSSHWHSTALCSSVSRQSQHMAFLHSWQGLPSAKSQNPTAMLGWQPNTTN